MAFKDELLRLRKQDGLTQAELALRLGLAKSTISMYERGKREPDFETLEAIADYFNVDMNRLTGIVQITSAAAAPVGISPKEYSLIRSYRKATPADRQIIDNIIARYPDDGAADVPAPEKTIPLFGTAAAAGPGEFDTGLPWEEYSVPASSRADFAVRVSGDSMEPVLHDGDIALCVEQAPQIGDVAVMMVNGCLVVKQYIRDNYGNIYLRSLNRARRDADLDVMASGNDTVTCYGTVILSKRPRLVDE